MNSRQAMALVQRELAIALEPENPIGEVFTEIIFERHARKQSDRKRLQKALEILCARLKGRKVRRNGAKPNPKQPELPIIVN